MIKVLIAYGTRNEITKEIAEKLAKEWESDEVNTILFNLNKIPNVDEQGII